MEPTEARRREAGAAWWAAWSTSESAERGRERSPPCRSRAPHPGEQPTPRSPPSGEHSQGAPSDPKFSANLKRDADRLYGARWVVERARRKGDLERLNEHLGAPYNLALDDDARDAAKRRRAAAAVLSMCRLLVGAAIWLNGNGAVGTASYIGKIAGVNDMCSRCE